MRIVCLTFGMAEISKDEIVKKLSKLAKVHNCWNRKLAVFKIFSSRKLLAGTPTATDGPSLDSLYVASPSS